MVGGRDKSENKNERGSLGRSIPPPSEAKASVEAPTYRIRVYKLLGFNRQASLRDNLFMDSFNLLIWNCRGAGIDNFKRNFKDLIRSHNPEIVGLLETKVSFRTMGTIFKTFGCPRMWTLMVEQGEFGCCGILPKCLLISRGCLPNLSMPKSLRIG